MPILPDLNDPAGNWNPLDTMWRVIHPFLHPGLDAKPTRIQPPAPIYDLPSPYGKQAHPENKDNIPFYVTPDYYKKLYVPPQYPVIQSNPAVWMVYQNISWQDMATTGLVATASGPAFVEVLNRMKHQKPSTPYQLIASIFIGLSFGYTLCYINSESRLQGYMRNEKDVAYWTAHVERENKIARGELVVEKTALQTTLASIMGPKKFDKESVEQAYYKE